MTYYKDASNKFSTDIFLLILFVNVLTRSQGMWHKHFFYLKMTYDDVILCMINEMNLSFENHERWVATDTKFDIKTQYDKVYKFCDFEINVMSLQCIINEMYRKLNMNNRRIA